MQWKKWLKQYGCQRPPALLLLGLNHGSNKVRPATPI
jgi:hypothetical protein